MQAWGNYIYFGIFFLILCGLFYYLRLRSQKKEISGKQRYLLETFELAQKQFAEFNIKFAETAGKKAGYSGLLQEITPRNLLLDVNGYITAGENDKDVDVFFRTQRDNEPVFYAFNTKILEIEPELQNSRLLLAMPDHLRIEKKRHFVRVKPDKNDIRVIGVWQIKPGKRLPRTSAEIGSPATHYKPGMKNEPVQVENISGAGLALRFASDQNHELQSQFTKGAQILCLVVYVLEGAEKPVAFWCTGEIMNSRITAGENPELILGLEFTNWAVLESASDEIHWAHSSPSRGAAPILQWVAQTERKHTLRGE